MKRTNYHCTASGDDNRDIQTQMDSQNNIIRDRSQTTKVAFSGAACRVLNN